METKENEGPRAAVETQVSKVTKETPETTEKVVI